MFSAAGIVMLGDDGDECGKELVEILARILAAKHDVGDLYG